MVARPSPSPYQRPLLHKYGTVQHLTSGGTMNPMEVEKSYPLFTPGGFIMAPGVLKSERA